jgi:hypothetical protein
MTAPDAKPSFAPDPHDGDAAGEGFSLCSPSRGRSRSALRWYSLQQKKIRIQFANIAASAANDNPQNAAIPDDSRQRERRAELDLLIASHATLRFHHVNRCNTVQPRHNCRAAMTKRRRKAPA